MSLDTWDEIRTAYQVARLGTVSGAAEVLGVLQRLKEEEGIAVALVTHDMAFASKAADRLVFFHEGEIAVNTTPDEAFNRSDNPELKKFVDAVRF